MTYFLAQMETDAREYFCLGIILCFVFVVGLVIGLNIGWSNATNHYQSQVDKGLVRYYDELNSQWLWKGKS